MKKNFILTATVVSLAALPVISVLGNEWNEGYTYNNETYSSYDYSSYSSEMSNSSSQEPEYHNECYMDSCIAVLTTDDDTDLCNFDSDCVSSSSSSSYSSSSQSSESSWSSSSVSAVNCSTKFMCSPGAGSGSYAGTYPAMCPTGCAKDKDQKSTCDTDETPSRNGQLYSCKAV